MGEFQNPNGSCDDKEGHVADIFKWDIKST